MTATTLAIALTAGALFADAVPVTAPEEMRKVPFIYCSDLFHPAMDPDDHFDLAAVFRLKEFDVKAVILDDVLSAQSVFGRLGTGALRKFGIARIN